MARECSNARQAAVETGQTAAADSADDFCTIVRFEDALNVFRSPEFNVVLHDGTEEFRGGTVRMIDGSPHLKRRKLMGTLLRGDGDEWFREHVLLPTIKRNLDAVLSTGDESESPRVDMVLFVRRAFFQLSAALIGLQGIEDMEAAEELRKLCEPINKAMRSWYIGGDREKIMACGLARKEEFRKRYFEPALKHHVELMEQVERGEIDESELPRDFLSLVASGAEPNWSSDRGLALREAITDMINAGTFSSSFTLIHTLDECLSWLDAHPDDRASMTDRKFVYRFVRESLRLHPVVPYLFRVAGEDKVLPSGTTIKEGETIRIDVRPANRDKDAFGEDADEFNPMREVRAGVYPFGLTFGTGRHMCFGLPIILGSAGANGSHVQMLHALFGAGVERDPDNPPVWNRDTKSLALWDSYPVVFHPPSS